MLAILIMTVIITSMGSILLASLVLKLNDRLLGNIIKYINAFAGGMLLAAAFIGLLPKALSLASPAHISYTLLAVISFFIILEKLMQQLHATKQQKSNVIQTGLMSLLLGSSVHSLLDGIVIVTAFYSSVSLGLVVGLSVFLHEIPRQVITLGVILRLKHSKRSAFMYNAAAGATMIAGGFLAYLFSQAIQPLLHYLFSFAAASFIYVSLSDLIPGLQKTLSIRESLYQLLLFVLAVLFVAISVWNSKQGIAMYFKIQLKYTALKCV